MIAWPLRTSMRLGVLLLVSFQQPVWSDGPADNKPAEVRPVPPPGMELTPDVRAELQAGVTQLQQRLLRLAQKDLSAAEQAKRALCEVLPRAVRMTVATEMFYGPHEIEAARGLLELGAARLDRLAAGASAMELLGASLPPGDRRLEKPRPVVGGYRSRIDGSVQPYGLILPAGWNPNSKAPLRLDVWLHGRGEKVSEVAFLQQRLKQLGEYTPDNTFVLHPYGRYCNAFKFAGEIDVLEAIEHVRQLFPIDSQRIVIRGFSMGGAGCWQLAVHYPDLWAAANPGAGFSETREFLKVFQKEDIRPTEFQQRLLHWYDCPDWTNNLRAVPTVAYSGEKDRQKQAADIMAAAFAIRGMELTHLIGPDTEHKIHADSKIEVEQFLSEALKPGKPLVPASIDLTTFSLRYHQLGWLSIEGLQEHWSESRVRGNWLPERNRIELTTTGVTRLALRFPAADGAPTTPIAELQIDGQSVALAGNWRAPQLSLVLSKTAAGQWTIDPSSKTERATHGRKRPGLQGPIDDAFMERFTLVGPEPGQANSPSDSWFDSEFAHATREWQRTFRGDPPVHAAPNGSAPDTQQNWILFGNPRSNRLIASLLNKLPIEWNDETLVVNGKSYSAKTHVPVMIYPNPVAPEHYLVLNSGFTFREYAQLNNARQVPMLPDWAVVDVSQGVTAELPGKIVDAGFFDERWQFK